MKTVPKNTLLSYVFIFWAASPKEKEHPVTLAVSNVSV